MTRPGSLLAACLAAAVPALAQQPVATESLHVFAERLPLLRSDGTQAITVLTRSQIESRHAACAADLLREMPGLHVDRLGGPGGASNLYIRGAEPNHTVVMIDGVRVNDPTDVRGGSFDLSGLAVDEIERIEVLRGASSAQFGADAMGGVVNIVTRGAERTTARVAVGIGGQGYREGHASLSSASARIGVHALDDGRDESGGSLSLRGASGALATRWSDASHTRLALRHAERESLSFPESSGGVRLAVNRALEARDVRESVASLTHVQQLTPWWRATVGASRFERREERDSPTVSPGPGGFVPGARSTSHLRRSALMAQTSLAALPWDTTIVAGGEWLRETGERDSVLRLDFDLPGRFERARDFRGGFVQVESTPLARTRLLLGVRADRVDPDISQRSGSAGLRFELAPGHALRAHWSEGFKPPSFFALGDPLVGNEALRPERSRSREAGWEARGTLGTAQATAFDSRLVDLVDFDPESFRMVNRNAARIRGAEVSGALDTAFARVEASYTYADARLEGSTARLRNRPRHRASLALVRSWGPWAARASLVRVGETFDFSVPTGDVTVPAHTVAALSLAWRSGSWSIAGSVDNALDREYEPFIGFRAPGPRARIKASFTL